MNKIMIYCQFQVKLKRLESSWKRTKTQQKQFFGKQCWENVVSNLPRFNPKYRNYDTIDEAWSLFFDDGIINTLLPTLINVSVK